MTSIGVARISRHRTVEARNKSAIIALRLLAVPEVAERHAPCSDGLLTQFALPRGETSGLANCARTGDRGAVRGKLHSESQ